MNQKQNKITFIDLFSGIGGFRLGMEKAGHICLGHCEIDKFAEKSYRMMHDIKKGEWYADDITKVGAEELPKADCWCFGFPCTPKECFRLQGFPDDYFEKAKKVNSNTQLYKQAGNSVTVNVIYEIAKKIGC